jgi:Glycosyltransferase family 87
VPRPLLFTHCPSPADMHFMRHRLSGLIVALMAAAMTLASPAVASATAPVKQILLIQQGTPMASVLSNDTVPLHFTASAAQAMKAAERSPALQSLHRRLHPLRVVPFVWRSTHPYWYVVFAYRGKIVADANVSPSGKLLGAWTGPQAVAPYTHGNYSSVLDGWMVLVPFSLLFFLPFLDPKRMRRLLHLDALVVLAFLISYLLLAHGHLEPAVWMAYPPLLYLLVRLLRAGLTTREPGGPGRLAPLLSLRTLAVGLPILLLARIILSLLGHQEIDVGYESVVGATHIAHHAQIYWPDPNHGDTYGPIAYLAYVPFELVFPWTGSLSNLHAADAAAIFFDLGTVVALFFLGRRLRRGAEGTRLGLIFGWAWAACPFTVIGLIVHTNDALISMLSVLTLLALSTPALSGALLGLASAAKFSPAGLLPLLAAPSRRGRKGALIFSAAFALIVAVSIFAWLPPGGLSYFWQRTIGFQLTRLDVFSPWTLHPALEPLKIVLEALAVLLVAATAFLRRERSLVQVAALAGALTIAIQLPAVHWFYYYILWFLPFLLVAVLGPGRSRELRSPEESTDGNRVMIEDRRPEIEPVPVGV